MESNMPEGSSLVDEQIQEQKDTICCPGNHALTGVKGQIAYEPCCDVCECLDLDKHDMFYRCDECSYDICQACAVAQITGNDEIANMLRDIQTGQTTYEEAPVMEEEEKTSEEVKQEYVDEQIDSSSGNSLNQVEEAQSIKEPVEAIIEQNQAQEEPAESNDEPAESNDEPAESNDESAGPNDEPTESIDEPVVSIDQPAEYIDEQVDQDEEEDHQEESDPELSQQYDRIVSGLMRKLTAMDIPADCNAAPELTELLNNELEQVQVMLEQM